MAEFVKVAQASAVPDPGRILLELDERIIALFHVGGEFFCIDDICTHDGGPLTEGLLDGYEVACPRHGARFDIRNGCAKTMPATEDTVAHEVRIEGDDVLVKLRDSNAAGTASSGHTAGFGGLPPLPAAIPLTAAGASRALATATVEATAPGAADARTITEDFVREELRRVLDPELFVNIVDLGLIYVIDLLPGDEGKTKVKIDMTMTSPMCPAGPQMIAQAKQVLSQFPEISGVEVRIVMDPPWGPDKMTEAARDQLGIF